MTQVLAAIPVVVPVATSGSAFARAQATAFAQVAATLPGAQLPWVARARAEALARFTATGLPDARDEAWKYTPLRSLAARTPTVGDATATTRPIDSHLVALPGLAGARVVFVNGAWREDLSDLAAIDRDTVNVMPLAQALARGADGLCHFLTESFAVPAGAFATLNAALHADGCVVRVADGAQVETPLHVVFVGAPVDGDTVVHVRNIVKLGAGASLRIVEHHVGEGEGAGVPLLNAVTQVVLADDARLTHLRVQEQSGSATVIARTQSTLAARAAYELTLLDLGAQLARHDLQIALDGVGASTTVAGAAVVNGRQHADLQLRIEHRARDTTSRVAFRGIADQRGRSVLGGAIVVQQGADGSDAALSNRNLLLSPHAEIDAKPELEIYADEVKAAHGATVGQLDETALFYLRSRGLPVAQARAMLTFAFVREMLEGVADTELREHLARRVISRLPTTREEVTR